MIPTTLSTSIQIHSLNQLHFPLSLLEIYHFPLLKTRYICGTNFTKWTAIIWEPGVQRNRAHGTNFSASSRKFVKAKDLCSGV